jgi:regulation of enolase protein 1 (concanavalin A-like superfamily)
MTASSNRLEDGVWLNPPAIWSIDDDRLNATTDAKTDFWQKTFYGFARDNGHFLAFPAPAAFTASVHIRGGFEHLYDQAGLMLRLDRENWIKTGVEFTDGALHLSTVITRGSSDWSVTTPTTPIEDFWLRLTAKDGAVRIQASLDGNTWPLLRLAHFPTDDPLQIGPMLCSPERGGLEVCFDRFHIGPPLTTDLHDLS